MENRNNIVWLLLAYSLLSCGSKQTDIAIKTSKDTATYHIVDSISNLFIEDLRKRREIPDTCYVNITYETSVNNNLYKAEISLSSRPLEGVVIPFRYVVYSKDRQRNIFFYYDEKIDFDRIRMTEELKRNKLLIEVKDGVIQQWDRGLFNDFESWTVLMCKADLKKNRILKSLSSVTQRSIDEDGICK
ncbi:MAG: hypothetical protein J0L66_18480 [Cytophagales bacterium]|nr:hypothetical protein [Cytophagales bacterium]